MSTTGVFHNTDRHPASPAHPLFSSEAFWHGVEFAITKKLTPASRITEIIVTPQPDTQNDSDNLEWDTPPAAIDHR
jgi:hypothetical protein